jgi:chromosome segregation ATPase
MGGVPANPVKAQAPASQELQTKIDQQSIHIRHLLSQKESLNKNIAQLRDEAAQTKKAADQFTTARQNELVQLQKQLSDETTRCKSLETTVADLRQKEQSSKDAAAAEISEMKASNQRLTESKSEAVQLNLKLMGKQAELKGRLKQQIANSALAGDVAKKQIKELEARVSSQRDELQEYEKRVIGLSQELDWNDAQRKRMREEWDARVEMEEKWRGDLQAITNDSMSLAERMRAAGASRDSTQQAALGEAPQRGTSGGSSRAPRSD